MVFRILPHESRAKARSEGPCGNRALPPCRFSFSILNPAAVQGRRCRKDGRQGMDQSSKASHLSFTSTIRDRNRSSERMLSRNGSRLLKRG